MDISKIKNIRNLSFDAFLGYLELNDSRVIVNKDGSERFIGNTGIMLEMKSVLSIKEQLGEEKFNKLINNKIYDFECFIKNNEILGEK